MKRITIQLSGGNETSVAKEIMSNVFGILERNDLADGYIHQETLPDNTHEIQIPSFVTQQHNYGGRFVNNAR